MSQNTDRSSGLMALTTVAGWRNLVARIQESPRWHKTFRRLPKYFTFLFVVLSLYSLALLTWQLMPAPTLRAQQSPVHQAAQQQRNVRLYNSGQIVRWSLFGKADQRKPKLPPVKLVKIKEANINLTLIGVTHSVHAHESRAFLRGPGLNAKPYKEGMRQGFKVGANLPGNARIEDILPDQIILMHNGERVSLKLNQAKTRKKLMEKLKSKAPATK